MLPPSVSTTPGPGPRERFGDSVGREVRLDRQICASGFEDADHSGHPLQVRSATTATMSSRAARARADHGLSGWRGRLAPRTSTPARPEWPRFVRDAAERAPRTARGSAAGAGAARARRAAQAGSDAPPRRLGRCPRDPPPGPLPRHGARRGSSWRCGGRHLRREHPRGTSGEATSPMVACPTEIPSMMPSGSSESSSRRPPNTTS